MANKYVFAFGELKLKGKEAAYVLGNKGAQLAEMTSLGLPVPPGFTITTHACMEFYKNNQQWPKGLEKEVREKLAELEKKMGKKLGDHENPLFVSVRSGAYASMPGMMDTVLNLGMNDKSVLAFAKQTKNERAAWDSYRRFIQMFGDVVLGIDHDKFEKILDEQKKTKGVKYDSELEIDDLKKIVAKYKELVLKEKGKEFPQDPWEQLRMAINAVFNSWNNPRAIAYRRINKISDDAGTAVNIQSMVFGNMGNDSGTGVGFTRNPSTGEKEPYGEFLVNAQGEDVVAGIRTPQHISKMKEILPKAYEELVKIYTKLEKHYKDMQDFEFTVEKGKLYMLQTRRGKRTAQAAVKIAVDMVKEGLITKEEAILRIEPNQLNQLLHKQLDPIAKQKEEVLAKGLAASPGAAVGKVVLNANKAKEIVERNPEEKLVLVRTETSPDDIEGMHVSQGFLTARGGLTSHAAVVARGMGKPCVAGCEDIVVYEDKGYIEIPTKGIKIKEGEFISIDGSTGEIFKGKLPLIEPQVKGEFKELMTWVDSFRKLGVRTNADTPHDAKVAREFGAEGIGLCRTEHMFFEGERIKAMREMILADNVESRRKALAKLLPYQKSDFIGIFEAMKGLDVTIRLLDPPLHEFLPKEDQEIEELAREMGYSVEKVKQINESLKEFNPMLGFRGCRLLIVYPEIAEMQVQAIIEAAIDCKKRKIDARPEIMIPVLGHVNEMKVMKEIIDKKAKEVMEKEGVQVKYKVGVMMELPRACITADKIAEYGEFFSFGTNDLTQTTFGYSRDDAGKFIKYYLDKKILLEDPFEVVDQEGVGELIKMSVERGRKTRKDLKIGICGEQGGEPKTVEFCHKVGLNYVSCSPYRVPIARLAAAQAAIKDSQDKKKSKKSKRN
ncbi:MAG: pyruvate, phosphate dikinase [Candidatus Diapherotrites archaeon]|nr:pyruvate, phosphate dikinase [Candidatus Diapherotrites archaeon]